MREERPNSVTINDKFVFEFVEIIESKLPWNNFNGDAHLDRVFVKPTILGSSSDAITLENNVLQSFVITDSDKNIIMYDNASIGRIIKVNSIYLDLNIVFDVYYKDKRVYYTKSIDLSD